MIDRRQEPMREAIIQVLSEVFGLPPERFGDDTAPATVEGWDSVRHVELVVALEERFGCMFDPEEVPDLTSLERIEEILSRHG
jgi:acyl carrier protein